MNDLAGFIDDSRTYTFHSRNPDRKISQISQYFKYFVFIIETFLFDLLIDSTSSSILPGFHRTTQFSHDFKWNVLK